MSDTEDLEIFASGMALQQVRVPVEQVTHTQVSINNRRKADPAITMSHSKAAELQQTVVCFTCLLCCYAPALASPSTHSSWGLTAAAAASQPPVSRRILQHSRLEHLAFKLQRGPRPSAALKQLQQC
jgi:hypothetical protein